MFALQAPQAPTSQERAPLEARTGGAVGEPLGQRDLTADIAKLELQRKQIRRKQWALIEALCELTLACEPIRIP